MNRDPEEKFRRGKRLKERARALYNEGDELIEEAFQELKDKYEKLRSQPKNYLMDKQDVAKELDISRPTLDAWIKKGIVNTFADTPKILQSELDRVKREQGKDKQGFITPSDISTPSPQPVLRVSRIDAATYWQLVARYRYH